MARTPATFLLLLLLVSSGLHVSCGCPDSCACRAPSLLNCSSAGLTSAPRPVRASVAQLDLSHNLLRAVAFDGPRPNLRDVWLGDNGVERLSLCVGGETGRTRRGRACESWAPALQLLSVERNRLQALPQGLESSRSLQVLQLSYNRISALRPGDLRHLQQLEELHLHHNLIRSLHPQTFQGLTRLRVLDLSFNMLTSLHPSTYLSLRHVGAEVALGGNRWRCDCGARGLRRRMSYDGSRGLRAWSLVCASPAALAGRDLLRLEDHDLDCSGADGGAELHRDVTVRRGSEILLTCARQDLSWWTPSGEASVSQPQAGLLISDFQETDTGLYVCVSEKLEVVSVFDLQISEVGESRRKARSLPGISRQMIPRETPDSSDRGRNQLIRATQSELDLAVCLSVFITFVVSFVLGVLARPCVDVLLRRFTREKSSATTSVSAVEQRQYDNEAFCHSEEPVFTGPHRERRVTFSTIDLTEEGHVKYYDTVNAGNQERVNDDAVIECEPAEAERDTNAAGGSGSKISVRESGAEESQMDLSGRTHEKEFEHIPDSVERRGSVSSRSDSSRSDKVVNSTQTSRKREEDSVQQRADYSTAAEEDVVHISLEGPSGLGFPTEPFADWSPHAKNTNLSDPGLWQENEEQFEFSDSAQSSSARSSTVRGSFNDSRLVSTLNKQKWVDSSNSSSNVSEDERTQNTVNKVAEDLERNLRKDGNFEQRILDDDAIGPSVQFNQGDYRPAVRPGESFSSFSSDGKGFTVKKGRVPSLVATSHGESLNTSAESSSPAAHRSSSSSESDAEHKHDLTKPIKRRAPQPPTHSDSRVEGGNKTMNHMQKQGETSAMELQIGVSQTGRHDPDTRWPVLDLEHIPHIKRRLDIKGPSHDSSSIKTGDETTRYTKRPVKMMTAGPPVLVSQTGSHNADSRWPVLDLEHIPHIKRRLDIKGPSPDSSSSSDSDQIKKPAQGNLSMAKLPSEVSQTVSYDQQTKWPVLDLGATTRIKRRLDIKGPSPDSSSSSDSEDEPTRYTERPGNVEIVGPSVLVSQRGSHNPDSRWPVLDLGHIPHIKRRLDIKGPSPDSSSSSDSEEEPTRYTERPGNVEIVGPSVLVSQTGSHNADSRWPVLDLEHIPHIKRRLDIKGPSPDSSSSSDSDQIKKPAQGNLSMAKLPSEVSQTVSYDQQTKWPVLDLGATTRIKRCLDIKGPSPDSSSSSDSEDEPTRYTERPGNVEIVGPSVLVSQTGSHNADSRWPVLDLEQIPHIKRRLDIKGPSPDSSSSSHSDQLKKPAQGNLSMAKLPSEVSQTVSYDQQTKWPVLDLGATTRIKRRLDIKGPSPDSSSSSDSEDEPTRYTERPGNVEIVGPSVLVSQTGSHNADSRWPVLDLEQIPHIKRRLDIKGPSPDSSSSSHSDQLKKPAQGNLSMAKLPSEVSQTVSYDQQTKWPVLDLGATTRIKRRLDIKGPSPDSTSSSDSEDETTRYTERPGKMEIAGPTSYQGRHDPDTRWPVLDLEASLRIKRRLDIKPPSPTPDSLSSGGGMNKMSSRRSSSSSDEQEGNVKNVRYRQTTVDPDGRWPDPELRSVSHVKKRLNIKARSPPPPESSSSSDHESEARSTNVEKQRIYVGITGYQSDRLSGTKKRLNIKGPSQPMDSESISSGEDENAKGLELSSVLKATKKEFTKSPNTQVISTSRSPKTDNSIQLEKYTVITEEVGDKTSLNISATPEINPELQSRWATMNLGVSRFRKRLDITANTREPPSPSSLAPPDSPSSSSSGTESTSNRTQGNGKGAGVQGIIYKESTIIPEDKPGKVSLGLKGRGDHSGDAVQGTEKSTKDYNRPTTERKPDTLLTGFSIPHVKRYLDIKVNEKVPPLEQLPDSFPSSSENEDASTKPVGEGWRKDASQHPTSLYSTQAVTVKPSQTELGRTKDEAELDRKLDSVRPELSLANIPRVRRALDIRAQRESRSSENETTSLSVPNLSLGIPRVKRRLNVKGPLPSSSSESESDTSQSRSASNMSGMTDNDSLIAYKRVIMKTSPLPGWSSSQSGQRETERVEQESPSFAPKRVPRVGFDNVVDGRTGRPIGGADIPTEIRWTSIGRQMPDLSVPSPTGRSSPFARDVSLSPGGGFEKLDAPKARNERRGLGALKAMSSDRRKWDATEGNWASVAAPRSDDTRFENHRSAGEVESSTSRETDLLYGIPRYRRHDLGGTGPPREAPPLIPTTQSLP